MDLSRCHRRRAHRCDQRGVGRDDSPCATLSADGAGRAVVLTAPGWAPTKQSDVRQPGSVISFSHPTPVTRRRGIAPSDIARGSGLRCVQRRSVHPITALEALDACEDALAVYVARVYVERMRESLIRRTPMLSQDGHQSCQGSRRVRLMLTGSRMATAERILRIMGSPHGAGVDRSAVALHMVTNTPRIARRSRNAKSNEFTAPSRWATLHPRRRCPVVRAGLSSRAHRCSVRCRRP